MFYIVCAIATGMIIVSLASMAAMVAVIALPVMLALHGATRRGQSVAPAAARPPARSEGDLTFVSLSDLAQQHAQQTNADTPARLHMSADDLVLYLLREASADLGMTPLPVASDPARNA